MSFLASDDLSNWRNGTYIIGYQTMGAQYGGDATDFAVWAPDAQTVHVGGDFNDWDARHNALRRDPATGIWYGQIEGVSPGQCYKYFITPKQGDAFFKADPVGFSHEQSWPRASFVYDLSGYEWSDGTWMNQRANHQRYDQPLSIYEVHLGSWKHHGSGRWLTYREMADDLVPYVADMGFTHIELMPITEYPFDASWGYQVTGFYAPTGRYGSPHDFMAFVDACHQAGLGLILDWVPGHFPKDDFGLPYFDGTPLYEHHDGRRREHADWGTHNFDFDNPGVCNFLLSSAFMWADKYHIDGFRVDAVASMLHLDYSKESGEWLANVHGGNANLGAMTFLQDFNRLMHQEYPAVLTIAEESTAWDGVTREVADGGLGFNYKWNMGWMHDTLEFLEYHPADRGLVSNFITFPIAYQYSERFILPFSHDEVVHLKKAMLEKMNGDDPQKFEQLKLLMVYMFTFPGKKHLFMGTELAERDEWQEWKEMNWGLLTYEPHRQNKDFLQNLLAFYRNSPALYNADINPNGFEWHDLSKTDRGFFAYMRQDETGEHQLLTLLNFSDRPVTTEASYMGEYEFTVCIDSQAYVPEKPLKLPLTVNPFQGVVLKPAPGAAPSTGGNRAAKPETASDNAAAEN